MDKREINSAPYTANFLFWIYAMGGMLLIALLGRYVWKVF